MRKCLFLGQKVFRSEGRNVREMLLGLLEGLAGTKEDQGHERGFCILLLSLYLGVSRKTSWNLYTLAFQKSFPATQIPALLECQERSTREKTGLFLFVWVFFAGNKTVDNVTQFWNYFNIKIMLPNIYRHILMLLWCCEIVVYKNKQGYKGSWEVQQPWIICCLKPVPVWFLFPCFLWCVCRCRFVHLKAHLPREAV